MTVRSHRARYTSADHSFRTSQQLTRQRPKCGLGACADGQLQKDMFDVRFHCLGRDLKGSSDAFIGETLADLCEDVAFPRGERIADPVPTGAQVADGFAAIECGIRV